MKEENDSLSKLIDKALEEATPSSDKPTMIFLCGTDEENEELLKRISGERREYKIDSWCGLPIIKER
jgi:predicted CopG family antitoxin